MVFKWRNVFQILEVMVGGCGHYRLLSQVTCEGSVNCDNSDTSADWQIGRLAVWQFGSLGV